jgi:hypothetical protein
MRRSISSYSAFSADRRNDVLQFSNETQAKVLEVLVSVNACQKEILFGVLISRLSVYRL